MALSQAQLAIRQQGIGGSELSAILGLSPFAGPLEVWNTKVYGSRFEPNDAMRVGTMGEAALAGIVAEMECVELAEGREYIHDGGGEATRSLFPEEPGARAFNGDLAEHLVDGTFRCKPYPRVLVTPDYIDHRYTTAYELKVVGPWSGSHSFSKLGEPVKYPEYYKRQAQMQSYVLSLPAAKLAVACQPHKLDSDLVADLWEAWEHQKTRSHVDFWFRQYITHSCDVRIYNLPISHSQAIQDAEFAQHWYDTYVVTGQRDPAWTPTQWRGARRRNTN